MTENKIASLLDSYETKDIEDVLTSPTLGRDLDIMGQSMSQADSLTQARVRRFLAQLLDVIDTDMDTLNKDMKDNLQSIEYVKKMSDACIAYLNKR